MKHGLYNVKTGKLVAEPEYDKIKISNSGDVVMLEGGGLKTLTFDSNGKPIDSNTPFIVNLKGTVFQQKGDKYRLVKSEVNPTPASNVQYDEVTQGYKSIAWARSGKNWYVFLNGKQTAGPFTNRDKGYGYLEYIDVWNNGKIGRLNNTTGRVELPAKFDSYETVPGYFVGLLGSGQNVTLEAYKNGVLKGRKVLTRRPTYLELQRWINSLPR